MAWDPFAEPEAADKIGMAVNLGDDGDDDGPAQISRADIDQICKDAMEKLQQEKPWRCSPDPTPDLLWHTPTCTAEDWRHKDVKLEVGDGIAYVIFNRPKENNSMNDTLCHGINDALYALHARPDIRVAVFTAEGSMFCAGGDPKSWQASAAKARGEVIEGDGTVGIRIPEKPQTPEVQEHIVALGEEALAAGAFPDGNVNYGRIIAAKQWHTWTTLPQFTICLCNGSAMGGGFGIPCMCDMVIALKKAFFVLSEVKIGVIPATISPYVTAKIGVANSKRLCCTAENLSAERAKEIGLVQEVVENMREGHARINAICELMSQCGPRAVQAAKQLVMGVANQPITHPLMFYTARILSEVTVSEEAQEGMKAIQAREKKPWESKPIKCLY